MLMKKTLLLPALFVAFSISAQDLKPTTTQALLKLKVVNDKQQPQASQFITFISLKDGKSFSATTDAKGAFNMLIPPAQKYKVKYKAFKSVESDLILDMPASASPYVYEFKITITPPKSFTLDNVFFDSGKSTLRAESDKELNELVEYMNLKKTLFIEIAGHTDNVGSADANLRLSEDRAQAVKQYLQKKGIAPERITAKGYGDTMPVAENDSAANRQKNRRTEVHILAE